MIPKHRKEQLRFRFNAVLMRRSIFISEHKVGFLVEKHLKVL